MTWATPTLAILAVVRADDPVWHGCVGRAVAGRALKTPITADTAVAHDEGREITVLTVLTDTPIDALLFDYLRWRGLVR